MAFPRIFVSSTCYDLQEIRFQLRQFILEFGYEPVMSEFDDIFYNYELHAQDSCLEEISKCQLFTLVVGNNYGSIYHKEKDDNTSPDSVTLKEFRKALETDIYKHVFINKFVDYDYKNYKRALDKILLKHFREHNINDDKIESTKLTIKKSFDETYPFPYDSYKYVFYFLDIIHELKEGNSYNTFESFGDIKESLKKQWAGFMYESLTKNDKRLNSSLQPIEDKIAHIDLNIKKLLEAKTTTSNSKISFDIVKLTRDINIDKLEEIQIKVDQILTSIFSYEVYNLTSKEFKYPKRVWFDYKFDIELSKKWLDNLKELVKNYKWSKSLLIKDVFKGFHISKYMKNYTEVPYKTIFELNSLYESLTKDDKSNFINTVMQRFIDAYEVPDIKDDDDNLPF
jgi:hypothetical protein